MRTDLRLKQFIAFGIAAVGLGLFGLGYGKSEACKWIGLALVAIAFIVMLSIRCPNCGHWLITRRWTVPEYCPHCGEPIYGPGTEE